MQSVLPPLDGWTIHRSSWLIEEQDIDALGHLNNNAAMMFFERARWLMITERGHGLHVIRERNQAPVIIAVEAQFRREVLLRQPVSIDTYTAAVSNRTQTVVQIMRDLEENILITASYTVGLFELVTRRLVPPTPLWRVAMGESSGSGA